MTTNCQELVSYAYKEMDANFFKQVYKNKEKLSGQEKTRLLFEHGLIYLGTFGLNPSNIKE